MVTASTLWGSWGAAEKAHTAQLTAFQLTARRGESRLCLRQSLGRRDVGAGEGAYGQGRAEMTAKRQPRPNRWRRQPQGPRNGAGAGARATASGAACPPRFHRPAEGRQEAASCTADDLIQERPFPADPGVTESAPGKSSRKMTQLAAEERAAQNRRGKISKNRIPVTPPCLHLLRARWPAASQPAVCPNASFN